MATPAGRLLHTLLSLQPSCSLKVQVPTFGCLSGCVAVPRSDVNLSLPCSIARRWRSVKAYAAILQAFVDRLHADKQRAVIIIEGGVKMDAAYQVFVEGLKRKAYIQDLTGNPYVGQVSSTQSG